MSNLKSLNRAALFFKPVPLLRTFPLYKSRQYLVLFVVSWLLLFLLYLPAVRAGFAGDYFKDWLQVVQEESFADYLNRPGTSTLYQFTQLLTYLIYQIIGSSRVGWHLVHLTMQAINCVLLFSFFSRLLADTGLKKASLIALSVVALFIVSPYNSEVVVHEPCLHYTIGLALVLLPLIWMQRFFRDGKKRYLIWGALLYMPASFSLEVFYLTPWLLLLFGGFYVFVLKAPGRFTDLLRLCFFPMIFIFCIHILLVRYFTHAGLPHEVPATFSGLFSEYQSKALRYLFHIALLGRFFPSELKANIYAVLQSPAAFIFFHALLFFAVLSIPFVRHKKLPALLTVLLITAVLFIAIVTPRAFPDMPWVVFDRYVYFALPFIYLLLAILLTRFAGRFFSATVFAAYIGISAYLLLQANSHWRDSNRIVENLLERFPLKNQNTTLLLNLPENYQGIPMIGSNRPSALKAAYNAKHEVKIAHEVHDIVSYNLNTPTDGAHVKVINDSTIHVTLNQWGTWWWFHYIGASNYENEVYRLHLTDPGHWYELIIRKPADSLQLLFVNEGQWRTVDMQNRNTEQY